MSGNVNNMSVLCKAKESLFTSYIGHLDDAIEKIQNLITALVWGNPAQDIAGVNWGTPGVAVEKLRNSWLILREILKLSEWPENKKFHVNEQIGRYDYLIGKIFTDFMNGKGMDLRYHKIQLLGMVLSGMETVKREMQGFENGGQDFPPIPPIFNLYR